MAVPDFQSFFRPLLEIANGGQECSLKETRQKLAKHFDLSDDDLKEYLPSGTQAKFDNRVAWAKSYLIQAKVLESPKRAHFRITDRGKELLAQGHEKITVKILNQYPEFVEFHSPKENGKTVPTPSTSNDQDVSETPEETLQKAYQSIRNDLKLKSWTISRPTLLNFLKNWL